MRKTCKCGNVLSDTTVPNNIIYWTYPIIEEEKLISRFNDVYPNLTQIAVWYCKHCNRFYHWGKDLFLYTYKLSKINNFDDVSVNWESTENLYYSFNDFEEEKMTEDYKLKQLIEFPRKVYGGTGFEKIYVLSNNKVKVYEIEEKLSMKE